MEHIIDQLETDFKRGDKHTVLSAWRDFGTTELRSAICKLKKRGHQFISQRIPGERIHEYYLKPAEA